MKKPSKKEIITCIQFFIMLYAMSIGFLSTYALIGYKCGLPIEWSVIVAMVLALLSVFGLCHWIWKEGKDNG